MTPNRSHEAREDLRLLSMHQCNRFPRFPKELQEIIEPIDANGVFRLKSYFGDYTKTLAMVDEKIGHP
jgi:hypothetical protein